MTLVLVVIADQVYRELVGELLDAREFPFLLCATWREAIALDVDQPAMIIADLDDIGRLAQGLAVFRRSGWSDGMPLIVLSHSKDVDQLAKDVGAAAGFRKPFDAGSLISTIARILEAPTADATIEENAGPNRQIADRGILKSQYGPAKWLDDGSQQTQTS